MLRNSLTSFLQTAGMMKQQNSAINTLGFQAKNPFQAPKCVKYELMFLV